MVSRLLLYHFKDGTGYKDPYFDAQIKRQFRIRCQRFPIIPSTTSSINHQSASCVSIIFSLFFVYSSANFDRQGKSFGGLLVWFSVTSQALCHFSGTQGTVLCVPVIANAIRTEELPSESTLFPGLFKQYANMFLSRTPCPVCTYPSALINLHNSGL